MKQTYLVIIAIALLGMAVIAFSPITRRTKSNNTLQQTTSASDSMQKTTTLNNATSESTTNGSASSAQPTQQASSGLKNGTFNGTISSNQFGDVNVSIIVSGGKITDVSFNTMPDGDQKSAQISNQVAPILKSQTLSAQSANIDGISGATYTTNSYVNSLQAAIDAARI